MKNPEVRPAFSSPGMKNSAAFTALSAKPARAGLKVRVTIFAQMKKRTPKMKKNGYDFTVRLNVMQRTVSLSKFCPYVCLSVCLTAACIVTKLNDELRIF